MKVYRFINVFAFAERLYVYNWHVLNWVWMRFLCEWVLSVQLNGLVASRCISSHFFWRCLRCNHLFEPIIDLLNLRIKYKNWSSSVIKNLIPYNRPTNFNSMNAFLPCFWPVFSPRSIASVYRHRCGQCPLQTMCETIIMNKYA